MNWQRAAARRARHERAEPAEPLFSDDGQSLEQSERRRAVETALAALPAEQREVVIMKVWGELTFSQIAGALRIPEPTAKSRYRYALRAMRSQINESAV
jgi:RNA polymerase sigma-70 factor (ECF subfamily)